MLNRIAEPSAPVSIVVFTGTSGLTHYAWSLARALSAHRDVELIAGQSCSSAGFPNLQCRVWPLFGRSRRYLVDLLRLCMHLLRHRHRSVAVQGLLKSAAIEGLVYRMLRSFGVRLVMTVHDALPHYPTRWSSATHRWLYRGVDRLVVHSKRTEEDLRRLGVDRPMHVIPHGVYDIFATDSLEAREARARFSIFSPEDFVVLFFGRVDRRKGIGAFLETRRELPPSEGWRWVVAGRNGIGRDEPDLAALLDAARQDSACLIRDDDVPFSEVQRYFRLADAVVLPYLEGTTSGVLKLAMAFGLPVVAADVGDLGEALRTDAFGLLVPAGPDAKALADALRRLRAGHEHFQLASLAAQAKYGWEAIAKQYGALLEPPPDGSVQSMREPT